MDKREWEKVERIVDEALEYPADKQLEYIKKECEGNSELLQRAKQLIDAIDESQSQGFLEDTVDKKEELIEDLLEESDTASERLIGKSLGKYKITELLGHGGMSSVFLAQRDDGEFDQQVALKLLRRGMDTPKNLSRFQLEQTILADLKHPNIAQLYDGGVTEEGLPYLVMEYVDGIPLTTYCDEHRLGIEERLKLFNDVCRAVQHAHSNLVIHRDLKPDNILVTEQGVVKILDFGISKLIQQDANTPMTQTQEAQQMLTPAYASPEQFTYDSITTAIDNYALGALLHKLLTGYPLFDLTEKSRTEISQLISRKMPQAPSKKLKELGQDQINQIARKRSTDPESLIDTLRGDLDAIVLKAVRKEQDERYDSPVSIIEDLDRYRNGQPVVARSGTFRYYFSKFIQRNRWPIAAVATFLLLTTSFGIFYTYQISQERNQARAQAERAERQKQRAEQITNFLVSILELNNPSENAGQQITVKDALENGIQDLQNTDMTPINRAVILGTIGSIQTNIGNVERAGTTLGNAMSIVTDSLGQQTAKSLGVGTEFAEWNTVVGNNEQAIKTFDTTDSLFHTYNLTDTPKYRTHLLTYSDFLQENGRYEKSLVVLNQLENALDELRNATQETRDARSDLYNSRGRAYKNLGQNQQALANLDRALKLKEDIYGQNNPKIAKLYHNMGVVHTTIGEFNKGLEMAQKAYEIKLEVFEPTHQLVGSTLRLLSNISMELGNYDQAFEYIKESVEINKKKHGTDHFRYALALREYAKALSGTGRFEDARQKIEQATSIIDENYGSGHPYYGYMMTTYGNIYFEAGNYVQAMNYGNQSITIFSNVFGDNHPNLGRAYANQGKYALKRDQLQLADSLLTTSLTILQNHFDESNPYLSEADSLLEVTQSRLSDN